MKLLLLGGFRFVGKYLVEAALRAGHEITVFNRGTQSEEYSEVEKLIGDRDGKLDPLQGRYWDAVIDTSGYVPRIVRQSLQVLADRVNHYTFISSVSVYQILTRPNVKEGDPVLKLEDESSEDVSQHYGALKAACEQEVHTVMKDRGLVIRPGLIVGPHDYTGRFTYWPWRVNLGGEILVPAPRNRPVQVIDVRDLADWTIRLVERQVTGTFNAIGEDTTFGELMDACQFVAGKSVQFTWVDEEFLRQNQVEHWIELPLMLYSDGPIGMLSVNKEKALKHRLRLRPLTETVQDTRNWALSRAHDIEWKAGLKPEREQTLLEAWHLARSRA